MTHEEFEKKLMQMLLFGEDEVLKKLRLQYELSKIKSREITRCGFFTIFEVSGDNEINVNDLTFQLGDVDASVNNVDFAYGFVLFIKDGYISMLEGYCNLLDNWQKNYEGIKLLYDSGNTRDLNEIRKKWI